MVAVPKREIKCEITKALMQGVKDGTDMCLVCKGSRLMCGRSYCPLIKRVSIATNPKRSDLLSTEMQGPSPPSIFVGHFGYPDVFMGPMSSIDPEDPRMLDDPSQWYGKDFDEIISMRTNLIRSEKREGVRSRSRDVLASQELALALRPTDIELEFRKKPVIDMSFSSMTQPMGPRGELKRFELTENVHIPRAVDKVVNDEIKASEGAFSLFDKGFDVYYLTKALASGSMGLKENKRMVPTRWSITAVDDMIAKDLMKEVRDFPSISDFRVYSNSYLDNHFEVLMMPGAWEFENFETWAPQTLWTLGQEKPVMQVEHEPFEGRKSYADKEGGGYYAARLPAVEKLHEIRRQARVVSFREIHEGYVMPVGVWEVRENLRQAFKKKPLSFATREEALAHIAKQLRADIRDYIRASTILRQRRLSDF
jgi:DNA repair protein NreA